MEDKSPELKNKDQYKEVMEQWKFNKKLSELKTVLENKYTDGLSHGVDSFTLSQKIMDSEEASELTHLVFTHFPFIRLVCKLVNEHITGSHLDLIDWDFGNFVQLTVFNVPMAHNVDYYEALDGQRLSQKTLGTIDAQSLLKLMELTVREYFTLINQTGDQELISRAPSIEISVDSPVLTGHTSPVFTIDAMKQMPNLWAETTYGIHVRERDVPIYPYLSIKTEVLNGAAMIKYLSTEFNDVLLCLQNYGGE